MTGLFQLIHTLCVCRAPDPLMYVCHLQALDAAVIIGAVVGGVGAMLIVLVVVVVVVCYCCCCRRKYTEKYQQYRCVMAQCWCHGVLVSWW